MDEEREKGQRSQWSAVDKSGFAGLLLALAKPTNQSCASQRWSVNSRNHPTLLEVFNTTLDHSSDLQLSETKPSNAFPNGCCPERVDTSFEENPPPKSPPPCNMAPVVDNWGGYTVLLRFSPTLCMEILLHWTFCVVLFRSSKVFHIAFLVWEREDCPRYAVRR